MRKQIFGYTILLLLFSSPLQAQPRPAFVFFGAGAFNPGADAKFFSGFRGGMNADASVFFPFYNKLRPLNNHRLAGLEFKMMYQRAGDGTPLMIREKEYRYYNGGAEPATVTLDKITYGNNRAWHALVGPAFVFSSGRFMLSPSVLIGYTSMTMQGLHYYDTIRSVSDPSLNRVRDFYYIPQRGNRFFSAHGSVKTGLKITPNISLLTSVQYVLGPSAGFWNMGYMPGGQKPPSGIYEFNQMINGVAWTGDGAQRWRGMALQANLCFHLGRKNSAGLRQVSNLPPVINRRPFHLVPPEQRLDIDLGERAKEKGVGEYLFKQRSLEDMLGDSNITIIKPHFISTTTGSEVIAEAMRKDSMAVKFQLFELENGKYLAIPFPGYYPRTAVRLQESCGTAGCKGGSGTCVSGGSIQFCSAIIKKEVLGEDQKINSLNKVYQSNGVEGEFLQMVYYTSVHGKKVKVVIEGRVDGECQSCWLTK